MSLGPQGIAALVPHAGAMCLLDAVLDWSDGDIRCRAVSHLRADHPLRRHGRLAALCGVEYALQAMALHGALRDGGRAQPAGYAAALRSVACGVAELDAPPGGPLLVSAACERADPGGMIYRFSVVREVDGHALVAGQAVVILPRIAPS